MKPFSILIVVLALAFAAVGCSEPECQLVPCPFIPAVTLVVLDAVDGGPVANPVVNGMACESLGLCTPRQVDGGIIGIGTSSFDVTAHGYGQVQIDVTVPAAPPGGPCSCHEDYVPQIRDVALAPL